MLSDARAAPTLAVNDMKRARSFYEGKLGLEVEAEVEDGVDVEGPVTLPSGVQRAFFRDPDGNMIGMRQLSE